jgi:CheY-like chemotaxis protein
MSDDLTKILHVEDDPDIQAVVKMALENIGGYKVQSCPNGRKAIEYVLTNPPQLILLDIMMPDIDGLSTLHAIRALPNDIDIPVIFVTAKVQKHEIDEYKSWGAAGVICKPFDAMTLPQTVGEFWEEWKRRRDAAPAFKGQQQDAVGKS